jgi:hypothetical protein
LNSAGKIRSCQDDIILLIYYTVQYYALEKEMRVLANDAKKGVLYSCPECRSNIRVRSGPHRQPHFYHLRKERNCRQHQKSLTHLQIQNRFSSLIGKDEIVLEKAFPEINRIADVAWENKKIIFEVQCSSISLAEARQRCEDYESLGLIPGSKKIFPTQILPNFSSHAFGNGGQFLNTTARKIYF